MPIDTTVAVSREIKSLLFVDDGSLNVVLVRFEDGRLAGEEFYRIEPVDAAPLLDVLPAEGLTMRQHIILAVYNFLVDRGMVKGAVSAGGVVAN